MCAGAYNTGASFRSTVSVAAVALAVGGGTGGDDDEDDGGGGGGDDPRRRHRLVRGDGGGGSSSGNAVAAAADTTARRWRHQRRPRQVNSVSRTRSGPVGDTVVEGVRNHADAEWRASRRRA